MGAAGEIGCAARLRSRPRGSNRRADRSPGAFDHLRRPRKADPPLRLARQRAVSDRIDVLGRVYEAKVVPIGGGAS